MKWGAPKIAKNDKTWTIVTFAISGAGAPILSYTLADCQGVHIKLFYGQLTKIFVTWAKNTCVRRCFKA